MYRTKTIDTVNALKKELDNKLPLKAKDNKRLQKKLRLEFNYNSNHLEGNTLTYGQTQLLLFFDKSSGDVPVSDIEEMKAHDVALSQIEEIAKEVKKISPDSEFIETAEARQYRESQAIRLQREEQSSKFDTLNELPETI